MGSLAVIIMAKKKKDLCKFNVLTWDFNRDSIEHYDVLPYFRNCYKERKRIQKQKRIQKILAEHPDTWKYYGLPLTWEEMRDFVEIEALSMFWGRCEWEMIIHGWPVRKNDYKIDVYEQIMMNIDTITDLLYNELSAK